MYLVKRHRKWWALHDIPPKLRPVMGLNRFAQNLETEDERTAKKRAGMLWLHDWSKQIEQARRGAPHKAEEESTFYRKLLAQTQSEEERTLLLDRMSDETQDMKDRALTKAGYIDPRPSPHTESNGISKRFILLGLRCSE